MNKKKRKCGRKPTCIHSVNGKCILWQPTFKRGKCISYISRMECELSDCLPDAFDMVLERLQKEREDFSPKE